MAVPSEQADSFFSGNSITRANFHEPSACRFSTSTIIPPGSLAVSDPVDLDVPALSDLAISLFLFQSTEATRFTFWRSRQTTFQRKGDSTATATFPVAKTISFWPFLTGVDVMASPRGAAIVAFGSSLTDGDGSPIGAGRMYSPSGCRKTETPNSEF